MTKRKTTFQKIRAFSEYGIHIWAILILANAALVYAFHFSTQAANDKLPDAIIQDSENGQPVEEEPGNGTQKPKGPLIDLTFTVPGIGSGGGTMQPKRLKRNITIFLYSRDVNSLNNTVKPLYTIKSTANYNNDENSPFYTTFYNHEIDLGTDVKDGDYQIAFRTDESLRTVIKESPDKVGGQLFGLSTGNGPIVLPVQTVLMGDTIPKEGDNTIDMSDYNAFVNCFGERNNSDFCNQSNYGDFDDNGVIDGVDYNVLLLSFRSLLKQGQAIPQISVTPVGPGRQVPLADTPVPTKKVKVSPTKKPEAEQASESSGSGAVLGLLFFLFFLGGLGVFGFLFFKNEQFRNKIKAIIHLSPTGTPTPTEEKPAEQATTEQPAPSTETPPAETPSPETTQETPPSAPAQPETTAAIPAETTETAENIASSTEIPLDQLKKEEASEGTAAPADGTIEKSCYVKKRLPDDAKTGFWLTLTDDNGALEAHYTAKDVADGFAKVKGIMKTENGKTFLEVSELTPEG